MQNEATAAPGGLVVADGYGTKIYVERGHLIVHYGVGRRRNTIRLHRATGRLKRLVVIGHTGYVTLDALRWIRDVGAAFVQIDSDGTLITVTAAARHHESKLRRAQVLAAETDIGRRALVQLLQAKLFAQADTADRLAHLKATVRVKDARPISVAASIREYAMALDASKSINELRQIESGAGRNYWQTWARQPVRFHSSWTKAVPDHWRLAGPRTSKAENKGRARKATSPVHAMLNYTYAILEAEATIAAHKLGLDPSLGLMHTDVRYRSSLATDLMEPARSAADRIVLDLLERREFKRGDLYETREGVCRVGPTIANDLARVAPDLRTAIAPHAERLARTVLKAPDHPTPLTRRRHRVANGHGAIPTS
jgi:CRISPR-associated endonuclease Cas1